MASLLYNRPDFCTFTIKRYFVLNNIISSALYSQSEWSMSIALSFQSIFDWLTPIRALSISDVPLKKYVMQWYKKYFSSRKYKLYINTKFKLNRLFWSCSKFGHFCNFLVITPESSDQIKKWKHTPNNYTNY